VTFTELTYTLANNHNLPQSTAKAVAKDLFALIKADIKQGGTVQVPAFGNFKLVRTNERKLNSAMGGGVCPAYNRIKFKPSKTVNGELN
jgi:nucleoid DNA-binding protein